MLNSRSVSSPSLSSGLRGSSTGVGKGWRGGTGRATTDLSAWRVRFRVAGVMMGVRMYSFIDVIVDGWNYVPSVAPCGAAFNPSWHLTPVGVGSSAFAGYV